LADWLGGWLKTIVLIILFATFIDLLLPNSALQRYVKTVVSLFILMTLLSPVIELFQRDWDYGKLLQAMQEEQANMPDLAEKTSSLSLRHIVEEGNKISESNNELAFRLMEEQAGKEIKEQIETEYGVQVRQVNVKSGIDGQGQAAFMHIQVVVSAEETMAMLREKEKVPHKATMRDEKDGLAIAPVAPVRVVVEGIKPHESSNRETNPERIPPEMDKLQEDIRLNINRTWLVPVNQIDIVFG